MVTIHMKYETLFDNKDDNFVSFYNVMKLSLILLGITNIPNDEDQLFYYYIEHYSKQCCDKLKAVP